jgi:hypothetical protein
MECELHKEESKLCESHIIPKFVYKWMKNTGTGRMRQVNTINKPIYDGIKKHMLCKQCEDRFSKHEKVFYERVFDPYLADKNFKVENDNSLKYFIISVLWRVLKLFKDDGTKYNFPKELKEAEHEWRNFLHNGETIENYKNIHLILLDESYCGTLESELYFLRSVDIEIAQSDEFCFIYAKFSRFMLVGEISGFLEGDFSNTNIDRETEFYNANQMIYDLIEYFQSRMNNMRGYYSLSENQQRKNDEYFKTKMKSLEGSEYLKIIRKHH